MNEITIVDDLICGAFGLNNTFCKLEKGHAGKHEYVAIPEPREVPPHTPAMAGADSLRPSPTRAVAELAMMGTAMAGAHTAAEVIVPHRRSQQARAEARKRLAKKKARKAARAARKRNRR